MLYRFTGPEPEDFPVPPIGCRLYPGDVLETPTEIEHARLELLADEPPGLVWSSPTHGLCRVGRAAPEGYQMAVPAEPETTKPPTRRAPTKE